MYKCFFLVNKDENVRQILVILKKDIIIDFFSYVEFVLT